MAGYSVLMQRTASASLSVGAIQAPATNMRRIKIFDLMVGFEGAPNDFAFLFQLQRSTSAGTFTAVTPQPLDPADAAAVSIGGSNATADPTLTANQFPLSFGINQRATSRWLAAPGKEIMIPATASNGIAVRTPTAGAATNITCTAMMEEQ